MDEKISFNIRIPIELYDHIKLLAKETLRSNNNMILELLEIGIENLEK